MVTLKIGGVQEHFNMPWHLLIQSGKPQKQDIDASWTDYPGGTGAMIEALNNGDLDIGMLLTEGAVSGVAHGGKYKILSFYVDSPLTWGIHVPANSDDYELDDLKGKKYAISRYRSGSHMMAFVNAKNMNWPVDTLKFEVVQNIEGARKAFREKTADIFLWEKFTTKFLVDNGEFRRIGECPTPFPCFVICASVAALQSKTQAVYEMIGMVLEAANSLFHHPDRVGIIARHYQLDEADVKEWFESVSWTKEQKLPKKIIDEVITILSELDLVPDSLCYEDVVHQKPFSLP